MINLKKYDKKKGTDKMGETRQGNTFHKMEDSYFYIKAWMEKYPWLVAGFTTKNGGFSQGFYTSNNLGLHVRDQKESVLKNRTQLANSIGFPLNRWIFAEQVHGARVMQVDQTWAGQGTDNYETSVPSCDGFYTDEPGIMLALAFADCVPVFFMAPDKKKIGIVHAGWKGTVKGIVTELLKAWQNEGIKPTEIHAAIGPSICKDCYIVDNKVIQEVEKLNIKNPSYYYQKVKEGQYALDLKGLNAALIGAFGVPWDQIERTDLCTSCHPEHFYSHRKSGGKTGRMLGFIGIRGNEG